MAAKHIEELTRLLRFHTHTEGNPFGKESSVGLLEGYPAMIAYAQIENQKAVVILTRFKKGSNKVSAEALIQQAAQSPPLLSAMEKKSVPTDKKSPFTVTEDLLLFTWNYTFKKPVPEKIASAVRALVDVVKSVAAPLNNDCEICDGKGRGQMAITESTLMVICVDCEKRALQENERAIAKYEELPANTLMGTTYGLGSMAGMAGAWGGVAYVTNRVFLYGAILIGVAIAYAVNKGMGKVTRYGQALTVVLTVGAVILGDFIFTLLVVAKDQNIPVNADLIQGLAAPFFELEITSSGGLMNVVFGVIGAIYIFYRNRKPVAKQKFSFVR